VTVTDDVGQTASAARQFAIVSSGVTASFTASPTNPRTTDTVQFNGVTSTAPAGATITEWEWDFGDGSSVVEESDPTTSHQFSSARTYVIRLTVTDSTGRTGTTTMNLAVAAP
jgi:PKD repeat protein